MQNPMRNLTSGLMLTLCLSAQADVVEQLQAGYQNQANSEFSQTSGEALWQRGFTDPKSGQQRSCTNCHTGDLAARGKHTRTGKPIEPMAPSVNPARLTDAGKVEKWFKRNCKWTLGRECTAQEKGDLLAFIGSR